MPITNGSLVNQTKW